MLLRDGGVIASGYDAELDELRNLSQNSEQFLLDLEQRERERTGINNLKVSYNRVHGYYIEVSKANLAMVPEDFQRRQTLAQCAGRRLAHPTRRAPSSKALRRSWGNTSSWRRRLAASSKISLS